MNDPIIGHRLFVDGARRPIYQDEQGHHLLEDGEWIDGLFIDPDQVLDQPLIVGTANNHSNQHRQ